MATRIKRFPLSVLLVATVAIVGVSNEACEAQTVLWTGASGDGLFTTAGNWNPAAVPGASSNVVNSIGGIIALNSSTSAIHIASLSTGTTDTVNTSNGALNVSNGAQLVVAGDISVISSDRLTVVGATGGFPSYSSQVVQQGGTLTIGSLAGDMATLYAGSDQHGVGMFTSNASTINIATYGSQLYADGGMVNLDTTNSNSTLTNTQASLFAQNNGTLNIDSGVVNNEQGAAIWASSDYLGNGTFIQGTTLNNSGTIYSDGGASNLPTTLSINDTTVNNGGNIFSGEVGEGVNDNAVVEIQTTNFNNIQDANTGVFGVVSAEFGSRLNLTTTDLTNNSGIESANDSKGTYYGTTVNLNVSGTLQNGASGSITSNYGGQLTIDGLNTGTFNNAGSVVAANWRAMSPATITVQNLSSPMTNTGSIESLNGGDIEINGNLTQTAGLTKVDGQMGVTGTFNLEGGVLNGTNGTLTANVVQTGGIWNPGEDPSSFSLVGGYTQNVGGILQMDIASSTSFDTLNVSNGIALNGGTLSLDFLNGYVPTSGTSWHFLTAGTGITGNFGSITSNLTGANFLFNPNTGIVSFGGAPSVPENRTAIGFVCLLITTAMLSTPRLRRTTSKQIVQ